MWSRSAPVDGFRLAFDRFGTRGAPAVVLLHGWPGNRHDYRRVVSILGDIADIVVPDLRGFGGSGKHEMAGRDLSNPTPHNQNIVRVLKENGPSQTVNAPHGLGSPVAPKGA